MISSLAVLHMRLQAAHRSTLGLLVGRRLRAARMTIRGLLVGRLAEEDVRRQRVSRDQPPACQRRTLGPVTDARLVSREQVTSKPSISDLNTGRHIPQPYQYLVGSCALLHTHACGLCATRTGLRVARQVP